MVPADGKREVERLLVRVLQLGKCCEEFLADPRMVSTKFLPTVEGSEMAVGSLAKKARRDFSDVV